MPFFSFSMIDSFGLFLRHIYEHLSVVDMLVCVSKTAQVTMAFVKVCSLKCQVVMRC